MPFDVKAAIKKPWVKYSLIGIAVFGVVLIVMKRGSSSTSSGGESDAQYAADEQYAQAQMQTSAAAAAQSSAQTFQLAQQTEADKTAITQQQQSIAGQLALNSDNNQTSIALGHIQLQGLQAQLNETQNVAQIQANEQMHISDNQTAVATGQTNAQASVAKTVSNNQVKTGAISAIAGVALAAFF
jgi:hypothetical protein